MLAKERLCALKKFHEQMAHPAQVKLEALIKNAGKWMASMKKELGTIYSQCETCKVLAKTPARPAFAMPRASTFNEVLTFNCKIQEGKLILYMIDYFSRLTKGMFIKSKKLAEAVNAIMLLWVAGGFGIPASLHTDVGGELTNAEIIEMAERLGCCVTSTAEDSPYMNGLNEKNHHTVSMIEENNLDLKPEETLAHALHAKNSLQMVHGFGS